MAARRPARIWPPPPAARSRWCTRLEDVAAPPSTASAACSSPTSGVLSAFSQPAPHGELPADDAGQALAHPPGHDPATARVLVRARRQHAEPLSDLSLAADRGRRRGGRRAARLLPRGARPGLGGFVRSTTSRRSSGSPRPLPEVRPSARSRHLPWGSAHRAVARALSQERVRRAALASSCSAAVRRSRHRRSAPPASRCRSSGRRSPRLAELRAVGLPARRAPSRRPAPAPAARRGRSAPARRSPSRARLGNEPRQRPVGQHGQRRQQPRRPDAEPGDADPRAVG